jgi:hypothetical protein
MFPSTPWLLWVCSEETVMLCLCDWVFGLIGASDRFSSLRPVVGAGDKDELGRWLLAAPLFPSPTLKLFAFLVFQLRLLGIATTPDRLGL